MSGKTAYDVVDRYDDAYYADLAARYRTRNRFARQRIANVFSVLPEVQGRVLLDLGCGMGTFAIEAARRGAFAVGIDPATAAIAAARRVAAAEGVERAVFVRTDAALLPLPDDSADIVLAADLTEHLDKDTLDRILREALRVLRSGGSLVLYTPEHAHLFERLRDRGILTQDSSHIGIRTAEQLQAAVETIGFRVHTNRWLPSHLPVLQIAERLFARWIPLLRRRIGLVACKP